MRLSRVLAPVACQPHIRFLRRPSRLPCRGSARVGSAPGGAPLGERGAEAAVGQSPVRRDQIRVGVSSPSVSTSEA